MGTIIHLPNVVQRRLPVRIVEPVVQPTAWPGPKPREFGEGAKIGPLIFRCPVAAHDIESGIEMDSQTFRWIGHLSVRLRCRRCHGAHELKVADGTLAWNAAMARRAPPELASPGHR
jgi:hypothetical protein